MVNKKELSARDIFFIDDGHCKLYDLAMGAI